MQLGANGNTRGWSMSLFPCSYETAPRVNTVDVGDLDVHLWTMQWGCLKFGGWEYTHRKESHYGMDDNATCTFFDHGHKR